MSDTSLGSFGLDPLPYAVVKTSRMRNAPLWTNRYRPSFVSRTASENRRKALVDYLAVAAGTKIDDNNFPNAVKQEREIRYVQKQTRGRTVILPRERTEMVLQHHHSNNNNNHICWSQSPPPTAPGYSPSSSSSVFLTQIPSSDQQKSNKFAPTNAGKCSFLCSPRPPSPTSNLMCCSVNNSPVNNNIHHHSSSHLRGPPLSTTPTNTENSPSEPYFSQWRKEFWSTEASKRGKILYFQVAKPAPIAYRPGVPISPSPIRKENYDNHLALLKQQLNENTGADTPPCKQTPAEKDNPNTPASPEKPSRSGNKEGKAATLPTDFAWSEEDHRVEVIFETGDGSFPLSYVDLRPVSAAAQQGSIVDNDTKEDGETSSNSNAEPKHSNSGELQSSNHQQSAEVTVDAQQELSVLIAATDEMSTVSIEDDHESGNNIDNNNDGGEEDVANKIEALTVAPNDEETEHQQAAAPLSSVGDGDEEQHHQQQQQAAEQPADDEYL